MKKVQNIQITGSRDKPIPLDIFHDETGKPQPIVIFCHGFKGFKDWGHFNLVAERFAENGFVFAKFNFSYNGTTPENPADFADLEAFGQNNFSTELNDLGLVIDYMETNAGDFQGNPKEIYLIGHSRGGGMAILKTGEDKRIRKLVTWASVKDAGDFFSGQDLNRWKEDGCIYTFNARTEQQMPLNYQIFEDYIRFKHRLDIPESAKGIAVPWLILHGTNDTSVSPACAEQLHRWNKGSELVLIENGDHTFGGRHPWTETSLPEMAEMAVIKSMGFFNTAR